MNNDPRTEPLKEWNRLARENTENAIVSSMFEAASRASEPIEQFSTWLLGGTAAVASFFIVNTDKLLPFVSQKGFLVCGAFLCTSCIAGLISKMYALRCKIRIETGDAARETFLEHLEKYKEEENRIKKGAEFWGISLESGVRMERVIKEFSKPYPKLIVWLGTRELSKHSGDPQIGFTPMIRILNKQGMFSFFQALLFLAFLVSGFLYASAIL